MISAFVEHSQIVSSRPWVVLGKGPSFDRWASIKDNNKHRISLGLNHVINHTPVDYWHVTDLDVLEACVGAFESGDSVLVMPWRPHVNFRVGKQSLADLLETHSIIKKAHKTQRLLTYRSSLDRQAPVGPGPKIEVRLFSGVSASSLLIKAGVRDLATLGIDEGVGYGKCFSMSTHLANGRKDFGGQLHLIQGMCRKKKVKWVKL